MNRRTTPLTIPRISPPRQLPLDTPSPARISGGFRHQRVGEDCGGEGRHVAVRRLSAEAAARGRGVSHRLRGGRADCADAARRRAARPRDLHPLAAGQ